MSLWLLMNAFTPCETHQVGLDYLFQLVEPIKAAA